MNSVVLSNLSAFVMYSYTLVSVRYFLGIFTLNKNWKRKQFCHLLTIWFSNFDLSCLGLPSLSLSLSHLLAFFYAKYWTFNWTLESHPTPHFFFLVPPTGVITVPVNLEIPLSSWNMWSLEMCSAHFSNSFPVFLCYINFALINSYGGKLMGRWFISHKVPCAD